MAKDINLEARRIIAKHTYSTMSSCCYKPESEMELWDFMTDGTSLILTEEFLEGNYTPKEYNDIRNEIGEILYKIFGDIC